MNLPDLVFVFQVWGIGAAGGRHDAILAEVDDELAIVIGDVPDRDDAQP